MRIHRIWMGNPMPERFVEFGQQWAELNPGYEVHDWTEEEIFDMKWDNQKVIDRMVHESQQPGADLVAFWTHVADVVDYELLYAYGGWYFNTDIKPVRPLSHLNDKYNMGRPGVAMEDDMWPVNAAMYAPNAGDPFYEAVITELAPRYFGNPGAFMNYTTGPHLLQHTIKKYRRLRPNLFHRNVFNPIHWSQFDFGQVPEYNREYPDETVASHIWHSKTNRRGQRILEGWDNGELYEGF